MHHVELLHGDHGASVMVIHWPTEGTAKAFFAEDSAWMKAVHAISKGAVPDLALFTLTHEESQSEHTHPAWYRRHAAAHMADYVPAHAAGIHHVAPVSAVASAACHCGAKCGCEPSCGTKNVQAGAVPPGTTHKA